MIDRIRTTRAGAGLSLGQASKLLGISAADLSLMELNGVHGDDDRLPLLAKIYGCSVRWLRGETAELSAENVALLRTCEHTGDRETLREFMLMISTRDLGAPMPSASERLTAIACKYSDEAPDVRSHVDLTVKRQHVAREARKAPTRRHHCHWPGCNTAVPPAMWGCRAHWFKLPKALRDRIWRTYAPGQEIDITPSEEYLQVADDVQRWIRDNSK